MLIKGFIGNLTKNLDKIVGVEGYYNKIVALSNEKIAISSGLNYNPNKTELVVYNLINTRIESRFTIGKKIVITMTLLQDGSIALILEYSSTIDIWNITSGKLMRSYDIKSITGYTASSVGYYIFSKLQNGAVFLYIGYPSFKICSLNLITGTLLYITDDKFTTRNDNEVIAISTFSDTKLVLRTTKTGTYDAFIKTINPKNGDNISDFKIENNTYQNFAEQIGLNMLPDGTIASTRYNGGGFLEVFDPNTNKFKMSLKISAIWVCGMDVLPNESLATLDGENVLRIFN